MKNENLGALLAAASSALGAAKVLGAQLSIRHQQQVILMDRLLREMCSTNPCDQEYRAVAYFGRVYYLPATYAYLATDDDGETYAYKDEPRYCLDSDAWFGDYCMAIDCRDDLDAATSLVEIDE